MQIFLFPPLCIAKFIFEKWIWEFFSLPFLGTIPFYEILNYLALFIF